MDSAQGEHHAPAFERFVELQKASGGLGNPRNRRGFVPFDGKTEAWVREVCFCAFTGKHSAKWHRDAERARTARIRARKLAERAKRRAEWKAYRARKRQPVKWNTGNRSRRAEWLLFAARVVGFIAVEKLRCSPVPLAHPRGGAGTISRGIYGDNLVERAVEAVTGGTRKATREMQRRIRAAWFRDGRAVLKKLSAKRLFSGGVNVRHPFTRVISALVEGRIPSESSPSTIGYIPAGPGREGVRTGKGRKSAPLGKRLFFLAAQGAASAQAAWHAARESGAETHLMPFRPSYAVAWFKRALLFGYDLRDAVAVATGPRAVSLVCEYCAKASGSGATGSAPWTPGGVWKALSAVLGESAAPFWGETSPEALQRRREARRAGHDFRAGLRAERLAAARVSLGLDAILNRVFA